MVVAHAHARLSDSELRTVERFVKLLAERFGDELVSVWLYGSRARAEATGPDSDIDLLVITSGGVKRDSQTVRELSLRAAQIEGENPFALAPYTGSPGWLAGRREIRSFFIQEVDRDKIVLFGEP